MKALLAAVSLAVLFILSATTSHAGISYDEQWITKPFFATKKALAVKFISAYPKRTLLVLDETGEISVFNNANKEDSLFMIKDGLQRGSLDKIVSVGYDKIIGLNYGKLVEFQSLTGKSGYYGSITPKNPVESFEWSNIDAYIGFIKSKTGNDSVVVMNKGESGQYQYDQFEIPAVDRYIFIPHGFAFFAKGDPSLDLNIVTCTTSCTLTKSMLPLSFKQIDALGVSERSSSSTDFSRNHIVVVDAKNCQIASIDLPSGRLIANDSPCTKRDDYKFLGFVSRPHGSHPAEITDVVIGNYDILKISKVTGKVSAEIQNGMAINYKEYFVNGAGVFLKSYNYNMFAAFSPEATIQPGTKMSYLEMEGFAWIVQQNQSTAGNTSIKILSYDMYNGVDGEFSAPGTTNTSAYLLDQNGQVPTAAIHWLDDKKVEGMVIAESRYEFGKGQYSPIFAFIPDAQAELSASETNAGVYTITTDGRLKFLKRIRTP